ncbi:MAG: endonuclease/exonuclease/phosphatase family protein [Acidobacteriota bacterium]
MLPRLLPLLALVLVLASCRPVAEDEVSVLWWNVENLFDTVDDATRDDDFTPLGRLAWTAERLDQKIDRLARVLGDTPAAAALPDIIGYCEVEHPALAEQLLAAAGADHYQLVAFESPDERGIDVGLAFDGERLEKLAEFRLPVELPDDHTRDIVGASFRFRGAKLHVFANHWPSRRNPAPVRRAAADVLRQAIDDLLAADPAADVLVLGDLNDEPGDPSVTEGLRAFEDWRRARRTPGALFNLWRGVKDPGTLVYRDEWFRLDHAIASAGLFDRQGFRLVGRRPMRVLRLPYLLNEGEPFRTYSWGEHVGGTSDHLPLLVRLRVVTP